MASTVQSCQPACRRIHLVVHGRAYRSRQRRVQPRLSLRILRASSFTGMTQCDGGGGCHLIWRPRSRAWQDPRARRCCVPWTVEDKEASKEFHGGVMMATTLVRLYVRGTENGDILLQGTSLETQVMDFFQCSGFYVRNLWIFPVDLLLYS